MPQVEVRSSPFGRTTDGTQVDRYELIADDGSGVAVLTLGTAVSEVRVPDREGRIANVALAHPDLSGYERNDPYFGVVVGRCANRIAGARFELDGRTVRLPANEGPNHLHGGPDGFHARVWEAEAETGPGEAAVVLRRVSPDGEAGYPGRLEATVRIAWSVRHELRVTCEARCDAATLANLTHHGSWNLAGEGSGGVDRHRLSVHADAYLAVDEALLPTGEIAPVAGTPLDLRAGPEIGPAVRSGHRQIRLANGIDHAFVLDAAQGVRPVARLEDPGTGRGMTVHSDQRSLQVYTGNALDGRLVGPSGRAYRQGDGVALEAQGFPDAPHHPAFPSSVLRPGETYLNETVFAFDVGARSS
ncbi:MAG: galactose-1-epimerase [Deinococcus-Thermus bacterium]|jgi:aldose 1-epimerase|nr:galactose-1-epimerase [Deinococcota bacterium]